MTFSHSCITQKCEGVDERRQWDRGQVTRNGTTKDTQTTQVAGCAKRALIAAGEAGLCTIIWASKLHVPSCTTMCWCSCLESTGPVRCLPHVESFLLCFAFGIFAALILAVWCWFDFTLKEEILAKLNGINVAPTVPDVQDSSLGRLKQGTAEIDERLHGLYHELDEVDGKLQCLRESMETVFDRLQWLEQFQRRMVEPTGRRFEYLRNE